MDLNTQIHTSETIMDKKTTGIIAVIITTILCGIPGLAGLCMSSLAIFGAFLPDSSIANDEVLLVVASSVTIAGLSLLCLIVPIGIGLWTWATKKPQKRKVISMEEITIPEDDF
jgi:formate hydrogenlyase subunit 3/multisubunit Na+/H+ antiporter MnhD subunit